MTKLMSKITMDSKHVFIDWDKIT